jgi:hypothetical protein
VEAEEATDIEVELDARRAQEQRSREREALRRRVRESLLRCPGGENPARA